MFKLPSFRRRCVLSLFASVVLFLVVNPLVPLVAVYAYDNGQVPVNTPESAKRMVEDLIATFGDQYPKGPEFLARLEEAAEPLRKNVNDKEAREKFEAVLREAALANPLLDFDQIALIRRTMKRRSANWGFIGLNSYTNDTITRNGWNNEIAVLSHLRSEPQLRSVYQHPEEAIMRDLDLHFDGDRIMFSSINEHGQWAIFEVGLDGKNLRELTPNDQRDVNWFDSCYLPEEGVIISASTAGMQGLPCENGGRPMVNLYRVECGSSDEPVPTQKVRQLTFEQDSDWHPSLLQDGRVMYLRWEYTDVPHYMSRMLFSMQPDGRQQRAMWGSGSYFPTAFKNPRAVPNSSWVVGVVSGHHAELGGLPEAGRLLILNPQLGSKYPFRFDPQSKEWGKELDHLNIFPRVFPKEVTGCVQEIPGYGRDVVGNVYDNQGGVGRYKFVYPYALSENYYLTSLRVGNKGMFGIWLVDRFDNMIKILELPNDALFQPIPLIARERPPVRSDITDSTDKEGTMFITDVYMGGGLKGVPRGTAKSLRIFSYHYGFRQSGGHESVGMVSSWDIKRILGTVPLEEDGSVMFKVPANTPISIQVLDEEGRALQLMRSWTICMPGEQQSCVGCHETPLDVTPAKRVLASSKPPRSIEPWYGSARPFGFEAEIQPMLDQNCVSCHNDVNKSERGMISFEAHHTGSWETDTAYAALNPFTWRPGPESDLDMLPPLDYHATVSELVQRLQKGHFGLEISKEVWDRLYTWIDLNVPYRGQWTNPTYEKRRQELALLYADVDVNPELEYRNSLSTRKTVVIPKLTPVQLDEVVKKQDVRDSLSVPDWPFNAETAQKMQADAGLVRLEKKKVVEMGKATGPKPGKPAHDESEPVDLDAQKITFVRIPAGEYIMGQLDGLPDERQRKVVRIEKPFWIAETEITNAQYAVFDPEHDTRYLREDGKDHIVPGYIANHPDQPVARVSFDESQQFCRWLSERLGKSVKLPTEAEWEWSARAGTQTPFYFGDRAADFSNYANLAGGEVRFTYTSWDGGSKVHLRRPYPEESLFPLREDRFSDKWFVVDYVKQYEPNSWGLYDMIGNVWEWTEPESGTVKKGQVVARGGSWKDRPKVTGSSSRVFYESWQKVMNVGFRPIIVD